MDAPDSRPLQIGPPKAFQIFYSFTRIHIHPQWDRVHKCLYISNICANAWASSQVLIILKIISETLQHSGSRGVGGVSGLKVWVSSAWRCMWAIKIDCILCGAPSVRGLCADVCVRAS